MIIDKEAYVISLDKDVSNIQQSWLDQGFTLNPIEATTPDTIPKHGPLVFDKKKRDSERAWNNPVVEFTPTEKAIWYSHYHMWYMSIHKDKPIIVIEDDVVLNSVFPTSWNIDRLKYFVRSHTPDRMTQRYEFVWGAGYVLTPQGAGKLIHLAETWPIDINVDGFLRKARDEHPESWCTEYATTIDKEVKAEHNYG